MSSQILWYDNHVYNVANILVKPTQIDTIVCPKPQNIAYIGDICRQDVRCTKAITALLTIPDVIGDITPIIKINIGKNLPNWCFLKVVNAINAANVWTIIEEINDHKNIWYHISEKWLKGLYEEKFNSIHMTIFASS